MDSFIGAILGALAGGGALWLLSEFWKLFPMMFGVGALLGLWLTILTIFIGELTGTVGGNLLMIKKKIKYADTDSVWYLQNFMLQ